MFTCAIIFIRKVSWTSLKVFSSDEENQSVIIYIHQEEDSQDCKLNTIQKASTKCYNYELNSNFWFKYEEKRIKLTLQITEKCEK